MIKETCKIELELLDPKMDTLLYDTLKALEKVDIIKINKFKTNAKSVEDEDYYFVEYEKGKHKTWSVRKKYNEEKPTCFLQCNTGITITTYYESYSILPRHMYQIELLSNDIIQGWVERVDETNEKIHVVKPQNEYSIGIEVNMNSIRKIAWMNKMR